MAADRASRGGIPHGRLSQQAIHCAMHGRYVVQRPNIKIIRHGGRSKIKHQIKRRNYIFWKGNIISFSCAKVELGIRKLESIITISNTLDWFGVLVKYR
jgi:hypothetical protein